MTHIEYFVLDDHLLLLYLSIETKIHDLSGSEAKSDHPQLEPGIQFAVSQAVTSIPTEGNEKYISYIFPALPGGKLSHRWHKTKIEERKKKN